MRISDWSSDVCSSDLAIVALAEIGDKTQLLAMLLATRFRKPVPIIFGILAATLANHALAALLGAQAAAFLDSPIFRYAIGASFVAMAAWTLIPDKLDDEDAPAPRFGDIGRAACRGRGG